MAKLIATWRMSLEALQCQYPRLLHGLPIENVLEDAVAMVEDNPCYHSVGYGGLPNQEGFVELDAAFMEGKNLNFGGVIGVRSLKNPIKAARLLAKSLRNCLLTGHGAEIFAEKHGFEFRNMLTSLAVEKWRTQNCLNHRNDALLEAYDGHDTVCILGTDQQGHSAVAVSTSGLFMKHPGRVGDSPIIGSGFYADDSSGSAAATGVGEDIMKGCLSYEICRLMESGMPPDEACSNALRRHHSKLERGGYKPGSISVIAMNKDQLWGAATNKTEFSFVVAENNDCTVYLLGAEQAALRPAPKDWLEKYAATLPRGSGF